MKILIANRGEIAVRVMRACREMGLRTVAVYAECDRGSPHVSYADEAWPLGGDLPADTYLRIDRLVEVARRAHAGAVHPGYGFLAENAAFARACREAGLVFIGPAPEVIELMGSKAAARAAAARAGVPVVPGTAEPVPPDLDEAGLAAAAGRVGYPLFVKAVAGGGGKGMRLVERPADLAAAVRAARSESASAFGDEAIYFERRLSAPRHVEIQLLGDAHGTIVPFVERECSIQRRHQKVIEESPSPAVSAWLRERMAEAAVAVAREAGYTNAGTVEFLLDADGRFYFLEVNARLQVEHPVTEAVAGVDLVHWQIRIARGDRLDLDARRTLLPNGHAIECRLYAEDPDAGFLPAPGRVDGLRLPSGPGIRVDAGVRPGYTVPVFYDPMIGKLTAWGRTRGDAVARLARALAECDVLGIPTTLPFFRWIVGQPEFLEGRFDTAYVDRVLAGRQGRAFAGPERDEEDVAVIAGALHLYFSAAGTAPGGTAAATGGGWARAARLEALRGSQRALRSVAAWKGGASAESPS